MVGKSDKSPCVQKEGRDQRVARQQPRNVASHVERGEASYT